MTDKVSKKIQDLHKQKTEMLHALWDSKHIPVGVSKGWLILPAM